MSSHKIVSGRRNTVCLWLAFKLSSAGVRKKTTWNPLRVSSFSICFLEINAYTYNGNVHIFYIIQLFERQLLDVIIFLSINEYSIKLNLDSLK